MKEKRISKSTFTLVVFLLAIVSWPTYGQKEGKTAKANKEWVAYAQKATIPILSRESDDFTDLMFLKEQIGSKRIVWLGENAHDINDNNLLKFRLIRFLHQEMGFRVVAFEGGVSNCGLANINKDSLNGMRLLVHSVMGYWRVKNNCQLFDYLKGSTMEFAGFDPNNNALYLPREYYHQMFPANSSLADMYYEADSLHTHYALERSQYFHSGKNDKKTEEVLNQRQKELLIQYDAVLSEINGKFRQNGITEGQQRIYQKAIASRQLVLRKPNALTKDAEKFHVTNAERDDIMAKNLEFIADSLYPDQKIIVWAHNGHISKRGYHSHDAVSMGSFLSPVHKSQSFVIGFYTSTENLKSKTFDNSLEAIYSLTDHKTGYLPIEKQIPVTSQNEWLYKTIRNAYALKPMPLAELYDGIIFMNGVEKSKLIPFNKEFRCE
ncbi:erythromycin esterase family protein [Pontibacter burrus]|uniref:Erythromycin esterase family protein n=1 Tax=Pontibacter burrus TaxID=2704466 RepID=A0A6B3LM27_9BACT|nr:erythromycin esterase family protein [Pontibacter burrus]NEM97982.1 erythromycin esterase family protein [Pontibacter burrus]